MEYEDCIKREKKRERQTCRSTEPDGTQYIYMIVIDDHYIVIVSRWKVFNPY